MVTTIQISEKLQGTLKMKKLYEKESYEEVIWDLLEDTMELSRQTKEDIKIAEKEISSGKVYTLDQIKKKLKL